MSGDTNEPTNSCRHGQTGEHGSDRYWAAPGARPHGTKAEFELCQELEMAYRPRQIDGKFHVLGGNVYKISSGEVVPSDEPLFLFRARDELAVHVLRAYYGICVAEGCVPEHLAGIEKAISEFTKYGATHATKKPGITRGAPWTPPDVDVSGKFKLQSKDELRDKTTTEVRTDDAFTQYQIDRILEIVKAHCRHLPTWQEMRALRILLRESTTQIPPEELQR